MENEFYTFLTSDDIKMNKTIMLNHMFKKTYDYLSNKGVKLSATCMNKCIDLCLRVFLSCKDPKCYKEITTDLNCQIEYNSNDPFFTKKEYLLHTSNTGEEERLAFKKILHSADINKVFSGSELDSIRKNSDIIIGAIDYFIDTIFLVLVKELEINTINVNASLFTHEDTRIRFRYGYRRVSGEFDITIASNVISRRSVNERYTDM